MSYTPEYIDTTSELISKEEINCVIDNAVEKINIIEFEFITWPAGENSSSPNASANWILNGIDFYFSKGFFSFFNALDENGITNKENRDVEIRKFDLDGKIVIEPQPSGDSVPSRLRLAVQVSFLLGISNSGLF